MKNLLSIIYTVIIVFAMQASPASAQNKINILRYNDDFSQLKKDSSKEGLQKLKYISIGKKNYISFGGELREQFQRYNNLNFGDVPQNFPAITTNQLMHRLLIHTNIELGTNLRLFVQLNNTLRLFNDNPVIPEIDENKLSLQQSFAEIKLNK